jgi:hypothetical protein
MLTSATPNAVNLPRRADASPLISSHKDLLRVPSQSLRVSQSVGSVYVMPIIELRLQLTRVCIGTHTRYSEDGNHGQFLQRVRTGFGLVSFDF